MHLFACMQVEVIHQVLVLGMFGHLSFGRMVNGFFGRVSEKEIQPNPMRFAYSSLIVLGIFDVMVNYLWVVMLLSFSLG